MIGKTYTADSIPQFLDVVSRLQSRWFPDSKNWGPWFRGHSDKSWHLTPKLYREAEPSRGIRVVEDEIRQEFVMRGPSLGRERPRNSWEWYFLMQHSGAPTRLLDWTEAALVALYFAIRDNRNKNGESRTDASVWALDPWWLNKKVLKVREVIPPGAAEGLGSADAKRYAPWLPDRYKDNKQLTKELPIALYPTHFAQRISSQRSCFTIHGSNRLGFEKMFEGQRGRLARIDIPMDAIDSIEDCLAVAGIDEITVFPDWDGLGRYLTSILRDEGRK
jgi:FRG domain